MKISKLRTGTLAMVGVALIAGLAACAPTSADQTPDTNDGGLKSSNYEADYAEWRTAFDDCMTKAGFKVPKPQQEGVAEGLPADMDMEAFGEAQQKCIDEVGQPPVNPDAPSEEESYEMDLAFARCMREAGYDFPDPSKNGMSPAVGADMDPADLERCQVESEKVSKGDK